MSDDLTLDQKADVYVWLWERWLRIRKMQPGQDYREIKGCFQQDVLEAARQDIVRQSDAAKFLGKSQQAISMKMKRDRQRIIRRWWHAVRRCFW